MTPPSFCRATITWRRCTFRVGHAPRCADFGAASPPRLSCLAAFVSDAGPVDRRRRLFGYGLAVATVVGAVQRVSERVVRTGRTISVDWLEAVCF